MKVRDVIVWLLEPVYGEPKPHSGKTMPRSTIGFTAVIGDTKSMAERLLKDVAQHPEDIAPSGEGPDLRGLGAAMGSIIAQVQSVVPPTPGTRWHNGCVEFTTNKDELLVVPVDRIAWIELGAEREEA